MGSETEQKGDCKILSALMDIGPYNHEIEGNVRLFEGSKFGHPK